MFPITRLAVSIANFERTTVNKYSKLAPKVGLDEATVLGTVKSFMGKEKVAPYSKNIFKRFINWVKTFVDYYKLINATVKNTVQGIKEKYNKKSLSRKEKKYINKIFVREVGAELKKNKTEMKQILEGLKEDFAAFKEVKKAKKSAKKSAKNAKKTSPKTQKKSTAAKNSKPVKEPVKTAEDVVENSSKKTSEKATNKASEKTSKTAE